MICLIETYHFGTTVLSIDVSDQNLQPIGIPDQFASTSLSSTTVAHLLIASTLPASTSLCEYAAPTLELPKASLLHLLKVSKPSQVQPGDDKDEGMGSRAAESTFWRLLVRN